MEAKSSGSKSASRELRILFRILIRNQLQDLDSGDQLLLYFKKGHLLLKIFFVNIYIFFSEEKTANFLPVKKV